MKITASVSGALDIAVRLDRMPAELKRRVRGEIEKLTERLFAAVQPPRRTGRTAAAKRMAIIETADMVRGQVFFEADGVEAAKIGTLEYGAPGGRKRPPVREHRRNLNRLWGRSVSPMQVIVGRYSRKANIREYRFLRGPLAAMRGDAQARIAQAVEESAGRVTKG